MENGTVEALVVIEDDEFPVGFDVVIDAMDEAEILHRPGREFLREIGELIGKQLRLRCEIQEDVAIPFGDMDAVKRVVLAMKSGGIHVGGAEEFAVESVGPAV